MIQLEQLGTTLDMKRRKTLVRVDDSAKRSKVAEARKQIYVNKYAVDNDRVEVLLQPQSLTPTTVSYVRLNLCLY